MIESIEKRRSIRRFEPDKPVTKEQLKRLLEAAMLAPSACNSRPWEFIAVTNRQQLDKIAWIHPHARMCATAAAAIIIIGIPQTNGLSVGYYPQDCSAAAQNILLEAVSIGLGACWSGIYPINELIQPFREHFKIEEPKIPFCVIPIGVPAETPGQRGFYEESKVTFLE